MSAWQLSYFNHHSSGK